MDTVEPKEVQVRRSLVSVLVTTLATIATVGGPAHASPPHPAAPVGTASITLPLLAVPLTVDVTAGPGGTLAAVAVNPADGFTATALKPNRVVFVNDVDGTRVVVRARHGASQVQTRASSLDDVSGPGSWSGDLFGDGTITDVTFVVGATSDGTPDIRDVATSFPGADIGEVRRDVKSSDDGETARAAVAIRFVAGTESRTLEIRVTLSTKDGETTAATSVKLSRTRGVRVPAAEAAGPQSWTGVLCDGSTASIAYVVAEDGAVSDVVVDPAGATVRTAERKIHVEFDKRNRVHIHVKPADGTIRIEVRELIRCKGPAPTVNTPVAEPDGQEATNDGRDVRTERKNRGDGKDRDNRGDRRSRSNDAD